MSVKVNEVIDPADIIDVNIDPCVIQPAAVADNQFRRDILRTQHCCHQSCIVKAYACFLRQHLVHIRKITALYRSGLGSVVGNVVDHIIVYIGDHADRICRRSRQLRALVYRSASV